MKRGRVVMTWFAVAWAIAARSYARGLRTLSSARMAAVSCASGSRRNYAACATCAVVSDATHPEISPKVNGW